MEKPKIELKSSYVKKFRDMEVGHTFLSDEGVLMMKIMDHYRPNAVSLEDGIVEQIDEDLELSGVDVKIVIDV